LVNEKEINKAGIDLQVGFSGRKPVSLDSLAQSGGERSVALMAFLLALQQHIASPFRAIDEFDVHMDPRNREIISRLIVNSAKSMKSGQYVAITPGRITMMDKDINIIVVQNIDGSSLVSELK
jgi:chromosome segregation protein